MFRIVSQKYLIFIVYFQIKQLIELSLDETLFTL